MATQRYISTSFWTDKWVRSLDPSERYLYMYLLTNPETNIAGVYDITLDRIAFDTGYDERTLKPMLDRFAAAGKAYYIDNEWVIIPSWPKHQKIGSKGNNRKGLEKILLEIPEHVFTQLQRLEYQYSYWEELGREPVEQHSTTSNDVERRSKASNYSDLDSDLDSDSDLREDSASPEAPAAPPPKTAVQKAPRELSPMKDSLAQYLQERITAVFPHEAWKNYGQERQQLNNLAKKIRNLLPRTPFDAEEDLAEAVLTSFGELKTGEKSSYWTTAAFTPSSIAGRWDAIIDNLARGQPEDLGDDYDSEEIFAS